MKTKSAASKKRAKARRLARMMSGREPTTGSIPPMTRDSVSPMIRDPIPRMMTSDLEGLPPVPVAASPVNPQATSFAYPMEVSNFKYGPEEDDDVSEGLDEEDEEDDEEEDEDEDRATIGQKSMVSQMSASENVSHLTNQVGISTGFATQSFSTPIPTPPMSEDSVTTLKSPAPAVPVMTSPSLNSQVQVHLENPGPEEIDVLYDASLKQESDTTVGSWAPGEAKRFSANPGDNLFIRTAEGSLIQTYKVKPFPPLQAIRVAPPPVEDIEVHINNPNPEPLKITQVLPESISEKSDRHAKINRIAGPGTICVVRAMPSDQLLVETTDGSFVGTFEVARFPYRQRFAAVPQPRVTTDVPPKVKVIVENPGLEPLYIFWVPHTDDSSSCEEEEEQDEDDTRKKEMPMGFSPPGRSLQLWAVPGDHFVVRKARGEFVDEFDAAPFPTEQTFKPRLTPFVSKCTTIPRKHKEKKEHKQALRKPRLTITSVPPESRRRVNQSTAPRPIKFNPQLTTQLKTTGAGLLPKSRRPVAPLLYGPHAYTNVQQPILQPRPIVNVPYGPHAYTNVRQPILQPRPTINESQGKDLEGGVENYGATETIEKSKEPKETFRPKVMDEKFTVNIPLAICCVLVPLTIFCVTYGFFGFYIRYAAAWVSYIVIILMCLLCLGLGAIAFMTESRSDRIWWSLMCVLSLVGWTWAVIGSNYAFETLSQPYYDLQRLNVYQHVDPSKDQGNEYMDFGILNFVRGATLDRNLSMHFKNNDIHCVAPVHMKGSNPSSYDFWATGTNCCSQYGSRYNFRCGDWNSPIARSGVRVVARAPREWFELATKQAATKYGIPVHNPVFFQWVEDPSDQISGLYNAAGASFWMGFVKFGCADFLFVFLCLLPFGKRWI